MSETSSNSGGGCGGCLGVIVAMMLSYKLYGMTWWMLLHGFFNWFYVAYWLFFQSGKF
jgi:hypothetical protein